MKKQLISFLVLIPLASFFLFGCATTENVSEEQKETKEVETTDQVELKVALDAQPPTLDPATTTAHATRDVTAPIFESLITFNSKYQPEPMLAESFETSEDGKTITFYLREGVLFHNGEEMTAEDVVASMNRWLEYSSRAKAAFEEATFEEIDEYTVALKLSKPNRTALSVMSSSIQLGAIMPKEVIEAVGDDEVDELIGTGPFQFEEWVHDEYIKLSKFDDYTAFDEPSDGPAGKKEALVDEIYFMIVTDASTRVAGIQSGEYDIAMQVPFDNFDQLEQDEEVETYTAPDGFDILVFNEKEGILTEQKIRQAIAATLDYEEILQASFSNEKFYKLNPSLMLEEQADWYTTAGEENYNQKDEEKAKQLLEEAGYDGEPITFVTSKEYLNQYNATVVIKEQLEQVGMNVEIDIFDWATVQEVRSDPSAYNAFITGFSINTDPTQFIFWDSKNEWDGWTNNPKIDELLDDIRLAESQEEAQKIHEALQQEHWDYVPAIKFGDKNAFFAHRVGIEGFQYVNGMILWNVSKEN